MSGLSPLVDRDGFRVYNADSLRVLECLSGPFDAVVTDPPYSSGGFTRGDRTMSTTAKYVQSGSSSREIGDFAGDNRDQRGYLAWSQLWMSKCLELLRPGGVIAVFTGWRQLPITTDAIQAAGFIWRGIVPWSKPSSRPQSGRFSASCEFVVWGSRGAMPVDYSAEVLPGFVECSPPRDRRHITEKPIELMRVLVRITPPGGRVLDPFLGSGTTAVACALEGRSCVGAEIVEGFCRVAAERVENALSGVSMDSPPEQLCFGDPAA